MEKQNYEVLIESGKFYVTFTTDISIALDTASLYTFLLGTVQHLREKSNIKHLYFVGLFTSQPKIDQTCLGVFASTYFEVNGDNISNTANFMDERVSFVIDTYNDSSHNYKYFVLKCIPLDENLCKKEEYSIETGPIMFTKHIRKIENDENIKTSSFDNIGLYILLSISVVCNICALLYIITTQ